MKSVFYFIKKALFLLEIFILLQFFPFLYTLSRYKRTNGNGIICGVMNWLAYADAIFEITQQPLYIPSSNLVR